MPVMPAGFSERVFEFSFNAEYVNKNKALLAGAPRIPTQNQEKWLGYDVEFELKAAGGAINSLALQHKVSRFVDSQGPSNSHFWNAIGGEYFAFRLDTDQFNLIESISTANLTGIQFYFCAPLFVSRKDMSDKFFANDVNAHSVWIDVGGAGQILDDDLHTIVYSPNGADAFRFSEKKVPLKTFNYEQRQQVQIVDKKLDQADIERIYKECHRVLKEYWPSRRGTTTVNLENPYRLPENLPIEEAATFSSLGRLLGRYFGSSVLVRYAP